MANLDDKLKPKKKNSIKIAMVNNGEVFLVRDNGKYQLPSETPINGETNVETVYRVLRGYFPEAEIKNVCQYITFEDQRISDKNLAPIPTYLVNFEGDVRGENNNQIYTEESQWVRNYENPRGLTKIGKQMDVLSKEVIWTIKKQEALERQNIDSRTQVFKSERNSE